MNPKLKKLLLSVLIAALVAGSTALIEGLLDILENFPSLLTGMTVGMLHYITTWKTNRTA